VCGPSCRHPFNLVHALRRMRAATRWSRVRAVTRPDTPVTQTLPKAVASRWEFTRVSYHAATNPPRTSTQRESYDLPLITSLMWS